MDIKISNELYLIQEKYGANSKILFVEDQVHEAPYALKGPSDRSPNIKQSIVDIKRELEIRQRINRHRNIVHCYGFFQNEGLPYMILEHVGGSTLREWSRSETFEIGLLLDIFIQIADALIFLHSKCDLVHGDLKPDNIVMGNNFTPKLLDFQHAVKSIEVKQGSSPNGTFPYGVGYVNNERDLKKGETLAYLMMLIELTFGTESLLGLIPPFILKLFRIPENWRPLASGKLSGMIPQKLADLLMNGIKDGVSGKQLRSLQDYRQELIAIYDSWLGIGVSEPSKQRLISVALQSLSSGNVREAKNNLLQLTSQYPNEPVIWSLLGSVAANLGEHSEAAKYSEKALSLDPQDQQALLTIATLLGLQGRLTEGVENLNKMLHTYPRNLNAWANLAQSFFYSGDPQRAFFCWAKVHSIDPEYPAVRDLLRTAEKAADPQSIAIVNCIKYSEVWYPKRYQR